MEVTILPIKCALALALALTLFNSFDTVACLLYVYLLCKCVRVSVPIQRAHRVDTAVGRVCLLRWQIEMLVENGNLIKHWRRVAKCLCNVRQVLTFGMHNKYIYLYI